MDDALRLTQLRQMKRRASALLVVVAAAFVALASSAPAGGTWGGYALAAAEGSLVGGLADWFAVTALFRHPLGLPIPHTAIIRERKEQFGETLGAFIQQNFLSADNVAERLRSARVAPRLAAWLASPANANRVAQVVLDAVVPAVELVGDDDVHRLLHGELERALENLRVAPLAGRALRAGIDEQRHRALIDGALKGAVTFLDEQREPLRGRFGEAAPWWLPGAVEDRIFDRIIDGARLLMASVAADPDHELRAVIDERLKTLADRLEHDPATAARVDDAVQGVLAHQELRGWTRTLWRDFKRALHEQAGDPDSRVHQRLAETVAGLGARLADDPLLQARMSSAAESAVRFVAEHHSDEISSLITATIARWDATETSNKLELLLGRDLQFIRINGTVVGGMAGVAIHALAQAFH